MSHLTLSTVSNQCEHCTTTVKLYADIQGCIYPHMCVDNWPNLHNQWAVVAWITCTGNFRWLESKQRLGLTWLELMLDMIWDLVPGDPMHLDINWLGNSSTPVQRWHSIVGRYVWMFQFCWTVGYHVVYLYVLLRTQNKGSRIPLCGNFRLLWSSCLLKYLLFHSVGPFSHNCQEAVFHFDCTGLVAVR